jgi:hypothetical protein
MTCVLCNPSPITLYAYYEFPKLSKFVLLDLFNHDNCPRSRWERPDPLNPWHDEFVMVRRAFTLIYIYIYTFIKLNNYIKLKNNL